MSRWISPGYPWKVKTTGLSGVKTASKSRSVMPCGCSVLGSNLNRSTTFTTRTFTSGRCSRSRAVAAKHSTVGTSPQLASTTSGSVPWSLLAQLAGYLLSGFAWSLAYALLGRLDPNSFVFSLGTKSSQSMNGFTGLYFSFITLSTVGYGDIIPVSEVARMLAIVEAMFGMFYMTLLIARLVSLYSSKSPLEITNREEILDKKRIESENSQTTSNNLEE